MSTVFSGIARKIPHIVIKADFLVMVGLLFDFSWRSLYFGFTRLSTDYAFLTVPCSVTRK
jgi:hypothetical protein